MTEIKHTEGEWKARLESQGYTQNYVFAKTGEDETGEENGRMVVMNILNPSDARLIAASPRMEKALKLYMKHQEGTSGHYCSVCHNEIEQALLKAGGG